MRYNEFKPLYEGPMWDWIKNVVQRAVNRTKNLLAQIGFGESVEIKLASSKRPPLKEAVNQALYGYMAEYSTCYELTKLIHEAGLAVSYRQGNGNLAHGKEGIKLAKSFHDEYAEYILSTAKETEKGKTQVEIESRSRAGEQMAQAMFDDALLPSDDLHLLHFEVIHSGESMKYETKADAVLRVTKEDTNEVVDEIKASLKSYKGWQVNLNNSTIISIFKNLGIQLKDKDAAFLKQGQDIRMKIFGIYRDAVNAVNKKGEEYTAVYDRSKKEVISIYGDEVWSPGMDDLFSAESVTSGLALTPAGRGPAKLVLQDAWKTIASDYLTEYAAILNKEYKANRETANEAFLKIMGFEKAEDFYLAVVNSKTAKEEFTVVTSRVSEEYKKLVNQFRNNLKLEFVHTAGNTASITISYYSGDNELIQSTAITIGKSGSMGMAKNNWFLDFKSLKR